MQRTFPKVPRVIYFHRPDYTGEEQTSRGSDTGVSPESDALHEASVTIVKNSEASHSLFGDKAAVISDILALVDECEEDDWNGEGAPAITDNVSGRAVSLIRSLPNDVRMPEISSEPMGRISLDWILTQHTLLSVSVGATDRLPFAWIQGEDSGHGVARFDGKKLPIKILLEIRAITRCADTSLRAA